MGKIYINPFNWGYVEDNTLIYENPTDEAEVKEMIDQALSDAVDDIVGEAVNSMDIKLEGENLKYKLVVNGNENGEIDIPKDQFLKSVTYDKDNKQLIFVMETSDGEATTEVAISDLVASIEDGVGEIQGMITEINNKNDEQDSALDLKADASALAEKADKSELQAVEAKVDAIDLTPYATKTDVEESYQPKGDYLTEHQDLSEYAKTADVQSALDLKADKTEVEAVDAKVDAIVIPDVSGFATKEELSEVETALNQEAQRATSVEGELQGKDTELQANIDALSDKVDAIVIPDVSGFATKTEVQEGYQPKGDYLTEHQDLSDYAKTADVQSALDLKADKTEVEAVDAKVEAIDLTPYATKADVEAKADASALESLATKAEVQAVDAKVDAIDLTPYATTEALAQETERATAKENDLETALNTESQRATNAESELQGKNTQLDAKIDNVQSELEAALADKADKSDLEPLATKAEVEAVDAKVDAIVVPSVEGLASEEYVDEKVGEKADAADVYTKTESDELFQPYGEYVPVEDYNALMQKVAALENYVNIFIKDREEKMDEIINNMDADNKEVVIETPMESIVVPETTIAYTITAPLADNSTVELTSPKYMTLFNTSEEPVSTTIGHTFVEGETTSATTVYLVGDFDTLTLENVSPAVKSGYDAASVNNVVITEDNVKNLTLALDIQDGATITNNSNASITIQDKNDISTTITIVAPNSTVTLNGSNYEVVNATVSGDTLIIKKNVGHIDTLNVAKGNVIVEVPRQSLIDEKIGEYTLAEGYTIDYLHDEIDSTNVANLAKEGTHTLVEDVTKTGNFSVGTFSTDDMIWELNGHSITSSNTRGYGIFRLRGSAHLEVNDSVGTGVVKNTDDDYGLWTGTVDSKIVINGGHFEASTHVLYAEKGTIEVNGGTFKLTNWETADKDENGNLRFLINCHDADYVSGDAKIIVRGGKFYDFDPGNCAAEGAGTSFLAEGYVSVESTEMIDGVQHKVYTVQAVN